MALVAGLVLAPQLSSVAVTDPVQFFPEDAPSRVADGVLARSFPGTRTASQVVVVLERDGDVGDVRDARGVVEGLVLRLRSELLVEDGRSAAVSGVLSFTDDVALERRLVSQDGRSALVVVRLAVGFASEQASAVVGRVERAVAEQLAGVPGLAYAVTGDATLGRDYLRAIEEGALRSALATVLLVTLALLLVYRAPLAAVVSLVTLGVALAVASGAVVLAARLGLPVAFQSRGFLVALVWGVGTDYCLLLFSRTREEALRVGAHGALPAALRATTPVLVTSALAVALACAWMGFGRFGLYSFSGPALAIGVTVTLIAVLTLAPALMTLSGGALFWPGQTRAQGQRAEDQTRAQGQRAEDQTRAQGQRAEERGGGVWPAIARLVVARPATVLAVGLVAIAPLASLGLRVVPSFELELDVPEGSPSEAGVAALVRHFDPARISPLLVVVELPESGSGLRTPDALDGLFQLTDQLARQPGVAGVWSAVRPTGEPGLLARATLRSQLGELAQGLGAATDGATRLGDGLESARRELARRRAELGARRSALDEEQKRSLLGSFAPDRFVEARRELAALDADLARLEGGLGEAARGAHELAAGAVRGRARLDALDGAPGSSRLLDRLALTPGDVAGSPELTRAFSHFLSADGHAALFELPLTTPPNASASVDTTERLAAFLALLLPAFGFDGARTHFAGATAITRDLSALTQADMARLGPWIVAGVFALLVALFRGIAAPIVITALILVSWLAALGTLELLVRAGVWQGVDWKAPFFLFVLLVAIGADYGVFLLGRAREELGPGLGPTRAPGQRAMDPRDAIARALEATGPVVTSCGLVLAGTFATLVLSRIAFLEQVGVGITIGVLIDTGVVRPFLLPAAALLLTPGRAGAPGEGMG